MKDEYLTIAEFAKRAGVTRQTIYNKLTSDLQNFTKLSNGKTLVNSKGLELFGIDSFDNSVNHTLTDLTLYFDKQLERFDRLIDLLEADNSKLHAELDIKNEQLKSANNRQAELSIMLDQQQKLNAHALLNGGIREQNPSPVNDIDAAYRKGKNDALGEVRHAVKLLINRYPAAADYLLDQLEKEKS